jgi:deazaflavin-dependent oxidoreductase (nitroreductase family)
MSAKFTEALTSRDELTIEVTGRSTGRQISVPVWFVTEEDEKKLYLVPIHGSDSDWYRNLVATPRLQLTADRARVSASATPIGDPARVHQVVENFRAKYGNQQVASYYSRTDAAVEVSLPD